ncbi:MAG TPA: aldo/keto reductase [Phycisphaerae bacterium]|nr:aldo/keto reductase [Phycisphaerae bacterium]
MIEKKRKLGASDVYVSPVMFGAWAIGGWMWGGSDENESIEAIRAAIGAGVNTIDTAAIYGMGYSEQVVAKAIAVFPRDKLVIATKCGMRWDDPKGEGVEPWEQKDNKGKVTIIRKNSKPSSITYECEQSLKRLNVDYIDLFQIHWPDASTKPEESFAAMEKLRKEGKIRAAGVSNYDVQWLKRSMTAGQLASLQPPFSLLQRGIEKELLPFCRKNNIGVIVYSPMERGLLTGKVTPDRKFPPGDHRAEHRLFTVENRKRVIAALESLKPIADKYKASYAQMVINWTFQQPGITAAIVGARNAEQARHNAGALNFQLSAEELSTVRKAFDPLAVS